MKDQAKKVSNTSDKVWDKRDPASSMYMGEMTPSAAASKAVFSSKSSRASRNTAKMPAPARRGLMIQGSLSKTPSARTRENPGVYLLNCLPLYSTTNGKPNDGAEGGSALVTWPLANNFA